MVVGLVMGRKGSVSFPGKNMYPVCGRPMSEWVILNAKHSLIDEVVITTDDPDLKDLGREHGCTVIDRPAELCTKEALGEDVFKHAYDQIHSDKIGMYVIMMCNAPTFLPRHIDRGIFLLLQDESLDSACTLSKFNWYAPNRARRLDNGLVAPFSAGMATGTCDRDSSGDCYFYDCCVAVVRPKCFEEIEEGQPPQRWLGKRIAPIENQGGLDVDEAWQIPMVEGYLNRHGLV